MLKEHEHASGSWTCT